MAITMRQKRATVATLLIFFGFAEWLAHLQAASGFLSKQGASRRISARKGIQKFVLQRPDISSSVHVVSSKLDTDQSATGNNGGDDENDRISKLMSYVNNLQRARKSGDLKAARSLAHYLSKNPIVVPTANIKPLSEACERALTQAFRTAGQKGDYRLVLQLVESSILYANNHPILTPRVFGEALSAIRVTGANVSKLKHIWNLVSTKEAPFLLNSLSAYELTTMIKALASRGKVGACVELYKRHTMENRDDGPVFIRPDAYTASTLFNILMESINADQQFDFVRFRVSGSSSVLEKSLKKLTYSPCWQWNSAVELLSTLKDKSQWNNHAYSSLLKLHDKAHETFPHNHENGPQTALAILDAMIKERILPDVVTCSLAIKAMGDPHSDPLSWKLAVTFFERMKSDRRLPYPNHYTYSAVIVACARCGEFQKALQLIEEMRTPHSEEVIDSLGFEPPKPNTWVYNAAFLAIGNPKTRQLAPLENVQKRHVMALQLFDRMKEDSIVSGLDTRPDTVTYNTIISILGTAQDELQSTESHTFDEQILALVDEMHKDGIPRAPKTYQNAVLSVASSTTIVQILDLCLDDLPGKTNGMTSVFNAALGVLSARRNFKLFREVYALMHNNKIRFDRATTTSIINLLGQSGQTARILEVLTALDKDEEKALIARQKLQEDCGLALLQTPLPPLAQEHFSTSITVCLLANNLEGAHAVSSLMQKNGITPTIKCLEDFSVAYARAALASAGKETTKKRKRKPLKSASLSRAQNAYKITMALRNPPLRVLSPVAKACAATGQWQETQTLLRTVHKKALEHGNSAGLNPRESEVLRALQTGILRQCARQGNVTAALWFADDIQRFSFQARKISKKADSDNETDKIHSTRDLREVWAAFKKSSGQSNDHFTRVGMRAEDWVSLVQAASESGHWRVCVGTMQFLRPYVERTNPCCSEETSEIKLETQHEQLSRALTAAARCLELRSQYAWGVRMIEEWMDWSGRKPRPEAVLPIIRILSRRSQGEQVKKLLTRCIEDGCPTNFSKRGVSYAEMLYIGTVTALHNNGLYDDADEVMVAGIKHGSLPFAFEEHDDRVELDLHGLNVALAHSSVRLAMRQQAGNANEAPTRDMHLITGRGRNSALRLRPVLRPEVQRMLLEEFYPPLNTISVPGNLGALLVFADDIAAWQSHQNEQKGARMQILATLLKNLSSTERLSKSIALSLEMRKELDKPSK